MKYQGIYLALRRTAATDATWFQEKICDITRFRLASMWCHGGMVCDGVLYHMTISGLKNTTDWTPHRWDLIKISDTYKPLLKEAIETHKDAKYDWFSLFGFILPWRVTDSERLYCFEFPATVLGVSHSDLVTPEKLLLACLKDKCV